MKSETRAIVVIYGKVLSVTWLLGIATLFLWRRVSITTLLYDQFLVITFLIFILSYFFVKRLFFKTNLNRTIIEKFAISFLISILFFSTIQYSVLTVDRSRSLYVLQWVQDGRILMNNGNVVILGNKKPEMKVIPAVAQRIEENKFRGLITKQSNGLQQLTALGKVHLTLAQVFAKFFNLKGWYENT
jgi:hypothetical protein